MPLRIVRVLGVVSRFIPQRSLIGKSRVRKKHPRSSEVDWTTRGSSQESAHTDVCDGMFRIRSLLLEDERTELAKLFEEIDQFSQTFKNADREQRRM